MTDLQSAGAVSPAEQSGDKSFPKTAGHFPPNRAQGLGYIICTELNVTHNKLNRFRRNSVWITRKEL